MYFVWSKSWKQKGLLAVFIEFAQGRQSDIFFSFWMWAKSFPILFGSMLVL